MGTSHPESLILGQIMQALPAMVLHIDRRGRCSLPDESIIVALDDMLPQLGDGLSLPETLAAELQNRAPDGIDLRRNEAPVEYEIEISGGHGPGNCLRTCLIPTTGRDGGPDGNLLFCYDISAQKQNESLLARKNSTLELLLACSNHSNRSNEFGQALRGCLEIICSFQNWLYDGWLVGHAYLLDERDPDLLVSSEIWSCRDRAAIEPFVELTHKLPIRRGQGIPGQVLDSGRAIWHGKEQHYGDMPRASLADECGLLSIVAVPVVDGERVVAVLEFFADDLRPPNEELLEVLVAIGRELGSVYNREDANRRLRYLADHDQLTGLVVMRVAYDRIERALAWAERHDDLAAVMFIDLDGFKQVNDKLGHDSGDELLRRVAANLAGCVRDVDTVARFGGDEFLVVLTGLRTPADAENVAANILRAIDRVYEIDGQPVRTSASIGIALSRGQRYSVDEMVHRADDAMYRAKQAGKNRYLVHA